jgi:patatin-like phospholipase/acyl hydrolase
VIAIADSKIGGFIALGLCLKGLSVEEAIRVFTTLAERAFEEPNFPWLLQFLKLFPWVTKMCRLILAYLQDSYYSARGLEETLKELFGSDLTMSNSVYATEAGLKVGIPVTTAV